MDEQQSGQQQFSGSGSSVDDNTQSATPELLKDPEGFDPTKAIPADIPPLLQRPPEENNFDPTQAIPADVLTKQAARSNLEQFMGGNQFMDRATFHQNNVTAKGDTTAIGRTASGAANILAGILDLGKSAIDTSNWEKADQWLGGKFQNLLQPYKDAVTLLDQGHPFDAAKAWVYGEYNNAKGFMAGTAAFVPQAASTLIGVGQGYNNVVNEINGLNALKRSIGLDPEDEEYLSALSQHFANKGVQKLYQSTGVDPSQTATQIGEMWPWFVAPELTGLSAGTGLAARLGESAPSVIQKTAELTARAGETGVRRGAPLAAGAAIASAGHPFIGAEVAAAALTDQPLRMGGILLSPARVVSHFTNWTADQIGKFADFLGTEGAPGDNFAQALTRDFQSSGDKLMRQAQDLRLQDPEIANDWLKVDQDGKMLHSYDDMPKEAQQILDKERAAQDEYNKANMWQRFVNTNKVLSSAVKGSVATAATIGEAGAIGGIFGNAQAAPGDYEPIRQGAETIAGIAAPLAPFAALSGFRNLRAEDAAKLIPIGQEYAGADHNSAYEDLSPDRKAEIDLINGMLSGTGKKIIVKAPGEINGNGRFNPHTGNGEVDADAVEKYGVHSHELSHVFDALGNDIIKNAYAKGYEGIENKDNSPLLVQFLNNYMDARRYSDPNAPNLTPDKLMKEGAAELTRYIFSKTSPAEFYGGKTGADIIKEKLQDALGFIKGEPEGTQTFGQFQVPYTKEQLQDVTNAIYEMGARAKAGTLPKGEPVTEPFVKPAPQTETYVSPETGFVHTRDIPPPPAGQTIDAQLMPKSLKDISDQVNSVSEAASPDWVKYFDQLDYMPKAASQWDNERPFTRKNIAMLAGMSREDGLKPFAQLSPTQQRQVTKYYNPATRISDYETPYEFMPPVPDPEKFPNFKNWFGNSVVKYEPEFAVSGEMVMDKIGIPKEKQQEYWSNMTPRIRNELIDAFRKHSGETGKPRPLFHATAAGENFEAFDPNQVRSLGFHFGTVDQANDVLNKKFSYGGKGIEYADNARILPVFLKMEHPLILDHDWGFTSPSRTVGQLRKANIIDDEEEKILQEKINNFDHGDNDLHQQWKNSASQLEQLQQSVTEQFPKEVTQALRNTFGFHTLGQDPRSLTNLLDIAQENNNTKLQTLAQKLINVNEKSKQLHAQWLKTIPTFEQSSVKHNKMISDVLKSKGYDGIIYPNEFEGNTEIYGWNSGNSYAVFDPSQIKSALGGQYTDDPRMNYMPKLDQNLENVIKDYAKETGLKYIPHSAYRPLIEGYSKDIADAYAMLQHRPDDPKVQKSYDALRDAIMAQYSALLKHGYTIEPWPKEGQPYANSDEMLHDLRDNKHLYYFETDRGYGDKGGSTPVNHPMLRGSGVFFNGKEALVNDIFRGVHDALGHGTMGFQFGPRGEYNAFLTHASTLPPESWGALATETLGQNSWTNFGPHMRDAQGNILKPGQPGYLSLPERPFTEQPANLLDFMPKLGETGPNIITANEVEGTNSRPVSYDEFLRLRSLGQSKLQEYQDKSSPTEALDKNWNDIVNHAYSEAQKSWGGTTIDTHTGKPITGQIGQGNQTGSGPFSLTGKLEGQSTIEIPENASKEQFNKAMQSAREQFPQLEYQNYGLGVFHDDKKGTIDIDPVITVPTAEDAEAVGAYTRAIGGAYDYSTGNGLFPPHVDVNTIPKGRTGASGLWDNTFVTGEGLDFRSEVAKQTGADPKKHFYEQKPEIQQAITDYMKTNQGADYMPKLTPLQVAEGVHIELSRRAEDFINSTPFVQKFGNDEDGRFSLVHALVDSVQGLPLVSDLRTIHEKLGMTPSEVEVLADGFKNTINRPEIEQRVRLGSFPTYSSEPPPPDLSGLKLSETDRPERTSDIYGIDNKNKYDQGLPPYDSGDPRNDEWWKRGESGGISEDFMPSFIPRNIRKFITPDEEHILDNTRNALERFQSIWNNRPTLKQGIEYAKLGAEQRKWYDDAADKINKIFGKDADRFSALLAATSANTAVEPNLEIALHTWDRWQLAGRPTDSASIQSVLADGIDDAMTNLRNQGRKDIARHSGATTYGNNVFRALSAPDASPEVLKLSGPKVGSFFPNLTNNTQLLREVTNDRHIAKFITGRPDVDSGIYGVRVRQNIRTKTPEYIATSAFIRQIADSLTKQLGEQWSPKQTQAAIWSQVLNQEGRGSGRVNVSTSESPNFSSRLDQYKQNLYAPF